MPSAMNLAMNADPPVPLLDTDGARNVPGPGIELDSWPALADCGLDADVPSELQRRHNNMNPDLSRRTFIAGMAASALSATSTAHATCPPDPLAVCNVTHLYSIRTAGIVEVRDADDIRNALRRWQGRVAIGGGRYSMGGQTALDGALQLDMRSMRRARWCAWRRACAGVIYRP
jgi:hypothetical protein